MCTVTFIPVNHTIFITHSRDESNQRAKATPPNEYTVNGHTLLYPRDGNAGGSWIGINKNGHTAMLLNGAFVAHPHLPPYRKSRGLIFLDIIAAPDLFVAYHAVSLADIEPFTVILWTSGHLYECRWDGIQKHVRQLPAGQPHTWSSATLYDDAIAEKRNNWLEQWLQKHPAPSAEDIITWHLSAGDGDAHNNVRMNRNDHMLTVSITAIEITTHACTMHYLDLIDNTRTGHAFHFTKAAAIQ